ncbi:unnamed protein product [Closterium sp. Yama58-4]|nr:unnamed protein product [Closterium sp. Yama58-4]
MNSLPDEILSRILFLATTPRNDSQVDAAASDAEPRAESDVSPCHGLGRVSKRWAALLPGVVRITAAADSSSRRKDPDDQDDSLLPVPTLSAPALLRTLSRAPSVTSLTLGDGAVDFYDHDFLTSVLAACPKLTRLSLGEPRFTAAPPPFTISLASLDSFFRAAAPQLQELALVLPPNVTELPDSVSSLSSLRVLRLRGNELAHPSDGLCLLPALRELHLSCPELWDLPENFGQLKVLTHLSIGECENFPVFRLPDSLGDLASLTSLRIDCSCHLHVPSSIGALQQLRRLELRRFDDELPGACDAWAKLEAVALDECRILSLPPTWLETLTRLTLRSCNHLESFPFDQVVRNPQLRHLTLEGVESIVPLHPLSRLTSLQRLKVSENIGQLAALEWLQLKGHVSEKGLPASLARLGALKFLSIECDNLDRLPDTLSCLSSLQEASLCCPALASLPPSFCLLSHLRTLTITGSNCLVTLPADFGSLGALRRLSIHSCSRLHSLPDSFSSLASLVHLTITKCPQLSTLPDGFGSLPRLARLTMTRCDSFTHLPTSFPSLPSLRVTNLSFCKRLHSLPSHMGLLPRLEVLHLQGCVALMSLPDSLRETRALRHVNVFDSGVAEGRSQAECKRGVFIESGRSVSRREGELGGSLMACNC